MLYQDLEINVHWWDFSCAEVGRRLQDFVLTEDIRKFDAPVINGQTTKGAWQRFGDVQQISLNIRLFGFGALTERMKTTLHEGHHSLKWGLDTESDAEFFAGGCIDQ